MPANVLFLSHGGGPLPLLGDLSHTDMVTNLQLIANNIAKPSAIVLISAHWEAELVTVTHASRPELIYDYYGFPDAAYDIEYPAPGQPALAEKVYALLDQAGDEARLDEKRGFDHGLFVPLKIMYPEADIPCIQVSLLNNLDPARHIELGKTLSWLEHENLLIVGSGFSFHNMRAFFRPGDAESDARNRAFEDWLIDTCSNQQLNETERYNRLVSWELAPHARYCHPREEHLLPLHVCYGVAQRACREVFTASILGKQASFYLW